MAQPIKNKDEIRLDYVTSNLSIRQIAAKYGVSKSTVSVWSRNEGWNIEKKAYLLEAGERAQEEYAKNIGQYLDKMTERHTKICTSADKLLEKVNQLLELDDALAPRDLKSISSTLLDIKMLHDIKTPESDDKDKPVTIRFEGAADDYAN